MNYNNITLNGMDWEWKKTVPGKIVSKTSEAFYQDVDGDAIIPIVALVDGILVDIRNQAVVDEFLRLKKLGLSDESRLTALKVFTHTDKDPLLIPIFIPQLNSVWLAGPSANEIKKRFGTSEKITTITEKLLCETGIPKLVATLVANVLYEESIQPRRYLQYFVATDISDVERQYRIFRE